MTIASYTVQKSYDPGFQSIKAKEIADSLFGLTNINAQYGLTAKAGGGATGAKQLIGGMNEVATVASANDSLLLPRAAPGTFVWLTNNAAANDAKLYTPEGATVTINGTSGATGVTITHAKSYLFACVSPTKWVSILTA